MYLYSDDNDKPSEFYEKATSNEELAIMVKSEKNCNNDSVRVGLSAMTASVGILGTV